VRRVALVGAGNIAEAHAAVLRRMADIDIAAIVDTDIERARRLARACGTQRVFVSVEALIDAGIVDAAHVLVPPPLHRPVAETLLHAGIHTLVEKPMATTVAECDALTAAAAAGNAALEVNHNFVHHPAHLAVKRHLAPGRLGTIRHVMCHFNLPLRQLAARQLSHWMFDTPRNLLLEQAVHPLSQIEDLIGPLRDITVLAAPPTMLTAGQTVMRSWDVALRSENATAQLHLSLGESFPSWGMTVICDDGQIVVDYVHNRVSRAETTKWPDFVDGFLGGAAAARALAAQSLRNLIAHGLSLARLWPRADPFYRSMQGSIAAFHRALDGDRDSLTGAAGRRIVEICTRIAASAGGLPATPRPTLEAAPDRAFDVAVLGGTGFIGAHLVARLLRDGKSVAVLARNLRNLAGLYDHPRIGLYRGDVTNRENVAAMVRRAPVIVNLAHGGGGGNWPEIERTLVGSARIVGECCLAAGVERLIHVSSIAALYLGDGAGTITGAMPADALSARRAHYARAKADAERALLALYRDRGLPVCILRPGIVLGAGGPAFHGGIGFYNAERHCLGWNGGRNALPLVLVDDVADAIVKAMIAAGLTGRCYNLVGDVRLSARDYVATLASVLRRPLRYHPQSVGKLFAVECGKWTIKRLTGRANVQLTSLRDLRSRGLTAQFDCADAKHDLDWQPVADRERFVADGIAIHAPR
jgi:predicted dehydrogenase/nucleoside-diphosphate-sugar epimerase